MASFHSVAPILYGKNVVRILAASLRRGHCAIGAGCLRAVSKPALNLLAGLISESPPIL